MRKILLKLTDFNLYKRTLALMLAFVMLFNLTSEVYAAALKKDPMQKAFKEESNKIKEVLTESYMEQEPTTTPCTGAQECYENSLEKFAQTAQRYEDIISNLAIYIHRNNVLNNGILLLVKAYETEKADFERELREFYARQESYEKNYDKYEEWLIRKAQQEKINKQEEDVLALLPENEREELRRNNEATKEYLRQGEAAWSAYEKEWVWLQEQKEKLEAKQAKLLQAEQAIQKAQKDAAKDNEESEKIFEKTFGANHKELLSNLSELEKFLSSQGINFEAIKGGYKEARARYEQELIAQNAAKTEKFINKIKEVGIAQCKAEISKQEMYDKQTGDTWKDWENRRKAFTAEKEMHKKCYGLPVLEISDFSKGDYGLSYEEYEEIKYREYRDKYVSKEQIKVTGKDEKTGKKRYSINLGKSWVKENGLKEAQEIAALFLLNDSLGIEALASLQSEKEAAQALMVNREELIELITEESEDWENILVVDSKTGEKRLFDINKDGNTPYFQQKAAEQRKKEEAQKIADNYLKKVEERTTKAHNAIFNYARKIKEEAYSQLRDNYFPKIVLLAANNTPGEIADKLGLDLGKYKKGLKVNEEYEVYAKQEKYNHIRSRKEVMESLDRLEKPRLEVLDWVFIAFPSTWMNYLIRQQDFDSKRYTIIHSEGKHSLFMLKELLKIYVQYFPEPDLSAWNKVAQATYKSNAKGMQEYMLQLANYVEDNSLRHELKKEPQLAKRGLEKDEFIRQMGPITVGLVADLLFFAAAAKGITTLARSIVMARALKALTPEGRMLFKAINKIAEVHPEAFVRYQNTLNNIKKFENTEKLTKEQINSLLRLRQNALVYEGQLFEKAKLLSDKSWQTQYSQLSGTFEKLSRSTQDISVFLEKYVATGQEQKYLEEITAYNKLVEKYNRNAKRILQDPQWVKYQNNLAEYENALRVVMNSKGQAVLDSQGKKMPAETKRIRQLKKQLNNKPKLKQEELDFAVAQDRAKQGQANVRNFNNKLKKPDYLKKVSDKKAKESMGYNRPQEVKVRKSAKEQVKEGKLNLKATTSFLWDNFTSGISGLLNSPKIASITFSGIGGEFAPTVVQREAGEVAKQANTVNQEKQIASTARPMQATTPFKPVQSSNTRLWDYFNYYKNTHIHKGLENIIAGYGASSIPMLSEVRAIGYTATQIGENTYQLNRDDDDLAQFAKGYYKDLTEEDIAKYINEGKVMFAQGQKPVEGITHPLVALSYEEAAQQVQAAKEEVASKNTMTNNRPATNVYSGMVAMSVIPGLPLILNYFARRSEAKAAAKADSTAEAEEYFAQSPLNVSSNHFFNKNTFLQTLKDAGVNRRNRIAKKADKLFAEVKLQTNEEFVEMARAARKEGKALPTSKEYNDLFAKNLQIAIANNPYLSQYAQAFAQSIEENAPKAVSQETYTLKLQDEKGEVIPDSFNITVEFADKTALSQWKKLNITKDETLMLVRSKDGSYELVLAKSDGSTRGIYEPFVVEGKTGIEKDYYRILGDIQSGAINKGEKLTFKVRLYSDRAFEISAMFAGMTEGLGGLPQATVAPEATALGIDDPKELQKNVSHSQLGNIASVIFTGLQKTLGLKSTLTIGLAGSVLGLGICAAAIGMPTLPAKIAGLAIGSFILGVFTNGAVKPTNSVYIKENSNDSNTGTARTGFANARASIGTMTGYLFFPISILFALTGIKAFAALYGITAIVPAIALGSLLLSKTRNFSKINPSNTGIAAELGAIGTAILQVFPNIWHNTKFAFTGGYKERVEEINNKKANKARTKEYENLIEQEQKVAREESNRSKGAQTKTSSLGDFVKVKVPAALSQYLLKMMGLVALYHFAGMMYNSGPGAIIGKYIKSPEGAFLVDAMQNSPAVGMVLGGIAGYFGAKIGVKIVNTIKAKKAQAQNAAAPAKAKAKENKPTNKFINGLKENAIPLITSVVMAAAAAMFPDAMLTLTSRLDPTAVAQIFTFFTAYIGVWLGRQYLSQLVKNGKLSPQGIIGGSGVLSTVVTGLAFIPGLPIGVRLALWGVAGLGFANLAGYENALAVDKYPGEKASVTMAYTLARLSGAATVVYGAFANTLASAGVAQPDIYALAIPFAALALATVLNGKYIGTFATEMNRWINKPVTQKVIQSKKDEILAKDEAAGIQRTKEELATVIAGELFETNSHSLSAIEKEIAKLNKEFEVRKVRDNVFAELKGMQTSIVTGTEDLTYDTFMKNEIEPLVKASERKGMDLKDIPFTAVAYKIASHYRITPAAIKAIEDKIAAEQKTMENDIRLDVFNKLYSMEQDSSSSNMNSNENQSNVEKAANKVKNDILGAI